MGEDFAAVRSLLIEHTTALALPGGRRVGQPGHAVAQQYLVDQLAQLELRPFAGESVVLPYGGSSAAGFANLVGVIPGRHRELPPLLVGAHYDSVLDGPCADDNATAVAVALAVARRFAAAPLQRDLVIAFFDAEEPPYYLSGQMGSTRFVVEQAAGRNFACAIILDLIGHDVEIQSPALAPWQAQLAALLVVSGCESAAYLPAAVAAAAAEPTGLAILPTHTSHIGDMSDYHAFRQAGQPFLFLTCGEGRYYHHLRDDLAWLNFDKVTRVYQLVCQLLTRLDATAGDQPAAAVETFAWEVRALQQLLGPAWQPLLALAGLAEIRDRQDLARLAAGLRQGLRA